MSLNGNGFSQWPSVVWHHQVAFNAKASPIALQWYGFFQCPFNGTASSSVPSMVWLLPVTLQWHGFFQCPFNGMISPVQFLLCPSMVCFSKWPLMVWLHPVAFNGMASHGDLKWYGFSEYLSMVLLLPVAFNSIVSSSDLQWYSFSQCPSMVWLHPVAFNCIASPSGLQW